MERAPRASREPEHGEGGFTVVEMVVAMTLLAGALMALAHLLFGSMAALDAVRQRSVYLELANAEMESLRALPYDDLGVSSSDPAYTTAYPGGRYDGFDAVIVDDGGAPAAVASETGGSTDEPVPYTVQRWVTWTDTAGGTGHQLKQITVRLEWQENRKATRSIVLRSVRYPGGLGEVTPANTDPTAVLSASPSSGIEAVNTVVVFDSAGSTDADGDSLTYTWSFGDGSPSVTGPMATHTYDTAGTYTAQLTVTDAHGGVAIASIDLAVADPDGNHAPTAYFSTSASEGVAPLSINFDASVSDDEDGDPLTFTWQWGDGTPDGTGVNATHTFNSAGTFTVVLTVTDPGGLIAQAQQTITPTPLNCDVVDGYFRNPSSAASANDILVNGSDKPSSTSFLFRATTNSACTSLSAHIPYAEGVWVVNLAEVSDAGGVKTWQASATFSNSARFTTGAAQTAEFWSPAADGSDERYPFSFTVHR